MQPRLIASKGHAHILGVHLEEDGINIAVVSRHGHRIHFCLFDAAGETEVFRAQLPHRLGDIHYGFIEGIGEGALYGLRAEGPWDEQQGHRFDLSKLLIDPYARQIDRPFQFDPALTQFGIETAALVPKCIVTPQAHKMEPHTPSTPQFIYEVQVKSFTQNHPDVPQDKRGRIAALAEPVILDYLTALGVDCVELMPLTAWIDERHLPPLGLNNAWGYNPISFMAPDPCLAPGGFEDIRQAVEALHERSIKVILDVVFNHTGESDALGATLSLRGLDHALYYRHHNGTLINDTGCGNTLAVEQSAVIRLVLDSLRTWAHSTGLDGFRFDLASIMGRTPTGFSAQSALLAAIEQDETLSRLIMIAEPWDIGPGGYQLGGFPARWHEWNDRYRDDVRSFWGRGGAGLGALATRLVGSQDVFSLTRSAQTSINFLAAHDGFTLRDLTLYAYKQNYANGEDNRDGKSDEQTCLACDVRLLLSCLFLSIGTPMLTAGDEFGRTQAGNNNAYAQDNEVTWLDWKNADQELIQHVSQLARLRKSLPHFSQKRFVTGAVQEGFQFPDCQWFALNGPSLDWHHPDQAGLICILSHEDQRLALVIKRGSLEQQINLPQRANHDWVEIHAIAAPIQKDQISVYEERRRVSRALSDDDLRQLALSSGIAPNWWDLEGVNHQVPIESLRHILKAMKIDPDRSTLNDEQQTNLSPLIASAHQQIRLNEISDDQRHILVQGENGFSYETIAAPGQIIERDFEPGYYKLSYKGSDSAARQIIVHPASCYLPHNLSAEHKITAFSSHLYSLRHRSVESLEGHEGIGDFKTLSHVADLAHRMNGSLVGINPLHHLFVNDRGRISPYQPSDRRFIDPIYLNIADVIKDLDLQQTRSFYADQSALFVQSESLRWIDYAQVWQLKNQCLESSFSEFTHHPDFDLYLKQNQAVLNDHCLFEVKAASEEASPERLRYRTFLQWLCERQLSLAARHHNLYRDLALGCAYDGGEVHAYRDLFLNHLSIGAPPDPFTRKGQIWHIPPQSPIRMMQNGFSHFRTLLQQNMRHAAALRIDHVLGLARQFWVPDGAEAMSGAYVQFPLQALLAILAIESHRQSCLVIGEDLGVLPVGLRDRLDHFDIHSTRMALFEKHQDWFKPADHYPRKAIVGLGSHDLPTFTGWRAGSDLKISADLGQINQMQRDEAHRQRQHEVRKFDETAQISFDHANAILADAHAFIAQTPCMICSVQIDDLVGETDQLNVPGTDREYPNWRRRLALSVDEAFSNQTAQSILERIKQHRP